MMPRTLTAFGLALLVLVLALLLPPPPRPEVPPQPLDLAGITEVEVRSDNETGIRFDSSDPPSLTQHDPEATVEVTRSGDRLVINASGHGYLDLWITLPNTVETLVVNGARVQSRTRRGPLEIRSTGEVSWDGDGAALRILDLREPLAPRTGGPVDGVDAAVLDDTHCGEDCAQVINIERGHIERLDVALSRGGLRIARADLVGEANITLGPRAWLSIDRARDLGHFRIKHQTETAAAEGEAQE